MGRCGSEIYVVIDFLKRIDRGEIEINWSKILAGIPGVSSQAVDGLNIEGKMIFSNYCRYSRELALNPKDGEEKCLGEMVFGSKFAPTALGKRTATCKCWPRCVR